MKIKVYIFNYCKYYESFDLLSKFLEKDVEVKIVDCKCDNFYQEDNFKFIGESFISLPNLGYSGQWNAMLNDLVEDENDDVILIINSDVYIGDLDFLLERIKKFYSIENSGMYAPNVRHCGWNFRKKMLSKIEDFHIVPSTDSVIWSLRKSIAFEVGKIDLGTNKWGWGIEVLASYYCKLKNKYVVRDYNLTCRHPKHTSYSKQESFRQQKEWFDSFDFSKDLWKHYMNRYNYGFNESGLLMG